MKGLKWNYYVGVKTDNGVKLVTKVNHREKMSYWNENEKPLKMTLSECKDLAWALCLNYFEAFVVTTLEDYVKQPFIKL